MIFVIGLWLYIITMLLDSEDEFLYSLIESVGLAGIITMSVSVSMFLWEKMP